MSKIRVELNTENVGKLLKSSEMAALCESKAHEIAAGCKNDAWVTTYTGATRVNASVMTDAKDNSLLKALYSAI